MMLCQHSHLCTYQGNQVWDRQYTGIVMRNNSIQGFDIHGEDEFMCARKMNVLKDLESMFGILDVGR